MAAQLQYSLSTTSETGSAVLHQQVVSATRPAAQFSTWREVTGATAVVKSSRSIVLEDRVMFWLEIWSGYIIHTSKAGGFQWLMAEDIREVAHVYQIANTVLQTHNFGTTVGVRCS